MSHDERVAVFSRFYEVYAAFLKSADDQTAYLQGNRMWSAIRHVFLAWLLDAVYTAYGVTFHSQDSREMLGTTNALLRDISSLETILTTMHEQRDIHRSVPATLQQVVDEADTVMASMMQGEQSLSVPQQRLATWAERSTGLPMSQHNDDHYSAFRMKAAQRLVRMEIAYRGDRYSERDPNQVMMIAQEHSMNHAGLLRVDGIRRLSGAIVMMGVSSYDVQDAIVNTLYEDQYAVMMEATEQGVPTDPTSVFHHDLKALVEIYLLAQLGAAIAHVEHYENIPWEWQEPMVSERLKTLITSGTFRDLGATLIQEHVEQRTRLNTAQAALAKPRTIV